MSENKKPNLIYVFADQLRYDALGCNGNERTQTANLDRLSGECACLDNCVSGHPVCAPYRASLFTGKYTVAKDGTGMVINEVRIGTNHRTFANVLDDGGYETSYIGKWHMYANVFNDHQNPDSSYIPKGADRLGFNGTFWAYNFHHRYYSPRAYYHDDSPKKIFYEGYEPDAQTTLAIGEIKRLSAAEKPFALFLSFGTPHDPWTKDNVPEKYLDKFRNVTFPKPRNYSRWNDRYADMWAKFFPLERRKLNEWQQIYSAMVADIDDNVGRLLATVDELGIADDTVFVFTSDHGEMFGAHGRRAKNIFYEEAVRVPFLVKWGDRLTGRKDFCMNTVDIMPTLLSLLGLQPPKEVQGKALDDCLTTGADNDGGSLLMGTGPTAVWCNGYEWRGFRDKQYTYAVYRRDGSEYLFDNKLDPYQQKNLAKNPDYSEIKSRLKTAMHAEMNRVGDGFCKNTDYRKSGWIKNRIVEG